MDEGTGDGIAPDRAQGDRAQVDRATGDRAAGKRATGAGTRPAKARHQARAQQLRWGCDTTRRKIRWSVAMKETFLDHLAATCNVRQSAFAIGVDPASAYYLRRADPAFVEGWGEALILGYEMLETQLVGHALSGGGRAIVNGATELTGPIDVDLALRLLAAHRVGQAPRRYGRQRQVAPAEETDAAILRKLDQMARRATGGDTAGDAESAA